MPDEDTTDVTTTDDTTTPDPKDAKIATLTAETVKYHKRAQTAEAAIKAMEGKVLSDEDRELFEAMKADKAKAEEDGAKAAGKFDELLAKKQEVFDAQIAEAQAKGATFQAAFQAVAVKAPIMAALAAAGVKSVAAAAHLIQTLHPHRGRAVLDDNGQAVVQVVDAQGNPVIDADCKPGETVGIDKLVAEFLATDTGKHFLPPSKDSGSGAHQGGEAGESVEELLKDPIKKQAYIEKHGGQAYLKLVSPATKSKK